MKNKIVAALLALFVGGFGAHKFYLGRPKIGVLYLIFCWTLIPGIIAFFEGLFLLGTDDSRFNRKYNKGLSASHSFSFEENVSPDIQEAKVAPAPVVKEKPYARRKYTSTKSSSKSLLQDDSQEKT